MSLVVVGFVLDKLTARFIPHLFNLNHNYFKRLFTPPLGDILDLSIGIRASSLFVRLNRLESKDVD